MHYKIIIQNPFERNEKVTDFVSAQTALQMFEQIDWQQLNQEIFGRQNDVVEHFYFYEIETDNVDGKHRLNISGEYTYGKTLQEKGPLFTLRYLFPHPQKKKKTITQELENCTYTFARQCLNAFLKNDIEYLENQFCSNDQERAPRTSKTGFFKLFFLALLAAVAFIHFRVGWHHLPLHWNRLKIELFPLQYEREAAENAKPVGENYLPEIDTTAATEAPLDTVLDTKK